MREKWQVEDLGGERGRPKRWHKRRRRQQDCVACTPAYIQCVCVCARVCMQVCARACAYTPACIPLNYRHALHKKTRKRKHTREHRDRPTCLLANANTPTPWPHTVLRSMYRCKKLNRKEKTRACVCVTSEALLLLAGISRTPAHNPFV